MRKYFYLFLLLTGFNALGQAKYTIQGDVSGIKQPLDWIYLYYYANGTSVSDSVRVKSGKYSFTGELAEPVHASLRVTYPDSANGKKVKYVFKRDYITIFLEPSSIKVVSTDSFSNASIKGSAAHDVYVQLEKKTKDINLRSEALNKQYSELSKARDEEGLRKLEKEFDKLEEERAVIYTDFLKSNPASPLGVYLVNRIAGWDIKPEKVEPLLALLPAKSLEQPSGRELKEKVEIAKKTGIGRYAMDFTQNDTLGNPVSLSSFRGKYLLIDFWASWCGPCRKENPNLVKAFARYKDKGFHVLGVSLDQPTGKEKWMKAIHDDGLTWTHVSDLKFWSNAVAVQYGIQAIPQNFLLDPEGKIVAKNLTGEDLEKKLGELLDK